MNVQPVMPSVLGMVPAGPRGTRATLMLMAELVRRYRVNQRVRDAALRLVGSVAGKDYLRELEALRLWVRSSVRYTRDVHGVETLHTPVAVLEMMQGDCDDQSTLLAAMLEAIGMRARFVAVGPSPRNFVHVFTEAFLPQWGWVAAETTEAVPLGWRPKMAGEMIQEIDG